MSSPARRPTIVHLLAEARRRRQETLERIPGNGKTVPLEELRSDDGVYHGSDLFTGVAVAYWPDGGVQEEQSFVDGKKDGAHRIYTPSAVLLEETPYRADLIEGLSWTWHDNGQMARELFALAGVPLFRRTWDDRGDLLEEYKLDENDWRYARVLKKLEDRSGSEV
jgi:antitoxin component YwqK of YwqJK toxin-antitoxin module